MAKFVKLDGADGQVWYVNPEHVSAINATSDNDDDATIKLIDGTVIPTSHSASAAKGKLSEQPASKP